MKKLNALILTALLASPLAAMADGFYVGGQVGYGAQKSELSDAIGGDKKDLETVIGSIKAGYDFNDYLGAEVRVSGVDKDSTGIKADYLASAYVKGMVPVSDSISLYGLVGATSVQMDKKVYGKDSIASASYGIGARYAMTDNVGINLEATQVSSHKDYELGGVSLGVDYKF